MNGEFDGIGGLLGGWEPVFTQWVPADAGVDLSADQAEVLWDYEVWLAGERRAAAEERAREMRLYWSGRPDPVMRQILRAYGVTAGQIGLVQRSAFSSEYRRRQRARVKRRRR